MYFYSSDTPEDVPQTAKKETSNLKKLSFGHNNADKLGAILSANKCISLEYLNLRRAKVTAEELNNIAPLFGKQGTVKTLVLDGIKLAGTGAFNNLFGLHHFARIFLIQSQKSAHLLNSMLGTVFYYSALKSFLL